MKFLLFFDHFVHYKLKFFKSFSWPEASSTIHNHQILIVWHRVKYILFFDASGCWMYFQYFLITSGKGAVFDWKFLDPVQKLSINYCSLTCRDRGILEIHLTSQNNKEEHIIHMTSYNQYLTIVYCGIQLRVRWNTWTFLDSSVICH